MLYAEAVRNFENASTWRPSGGAELLLANVKYTPMEGRAFTDYSSILRINLHLMKDGSLFDFFENTFRFAGQYRTTDPVGEFSSYMMKKTSKSKIFSGALDWIKSLIKIDLQGMETYTVQDFRKS